MLKLGFTILGLVLVMGGAISKFALGLFFIRVPVMFIGTVLLLLVVASFLDDLIRFFGPLIFTVLAITIGGSVVATLVALGLWPNFLPHLEP